MKKDNKDKILNEFRKLKNEMVRAKVDEVFRKQPKDYISGLEEIGFKYYEDEIDPEEMEEKNASAENQDQQALVDFFNGKQDCSEEILEIFSRVRDSENPNLPLLRKYFKAANQNLKSLILYGLDHYTAKIDLLFDLAYFHEFENVLGLLCDYFIRACRNEMNLETFTDLATEFYFATQPDGYDALYVLRELFPSNTEKREIIDFLIKEYTETENPPGSIEI